MITLDEKKVEEIKRSRFPTLSPAQFELRLLKAMLALNLSNAEVDAIWVDEV